MIFLIFLIFSSPLFASDHIIEESQVLIHNEPQKLELSSVSVSNFSWRDMPPELVQYISKFLSNKDFFNFFLSDKQIAHDLSLEMLHRKTEYCNREIVTIFKRNGVLQWHKIGYKVFDPENPFNVGPTIFKLESFSHYWLPELALKFKNAGQIIFTQPQLSYLKPESWDVLPQLFRQSPNLERLDFTGHHMTGYPVQCLSTGLSYAANLARLDLGRTKITDADIAPLFQGLLAIKNLNYFSLWCNEISDQGAVQIASYLPQFSQLETLNLSQNKIGFDGEMALLNQTIFLKRATKISLNSVMLDFTGTVKATRHFWPAKLSADQWEILAINMRRLYPGINLQLR